MLISLSFNSLSLPHSPLTCIHNTSGIISLGPINMQGTGLDSPSVGAVCGALSQCCPGACRARCAGAHSMVLRPLFDANFSARTDKIHCNRRPKVHLLYRCVLKHRTCAHEGKSDATMLHTGRPTWSATPQKLPRDALNAGKHCCCGRGRSQQRLHRAAATRAILATAAYHALLPVEARGTRTEERGGAQGCVSPSSRCHVPTSKRHVTCQQSSPPLPLLHHCSVKSPPGPCKPSFVTTAHVHST